MSTEKRCTSIECPCGRSPEDSMLQSQSVILTWSLAALLQWGVFELVTNLARPLVWCIANSHNRLCSATACFLQREKCQTPLINLDLVLNLPGVNPQGKPTTRKSSYLYCILWFWILEEQFWWLPNHYFIIAESSFIYFFLFSFCSDQGWAFMWAGGYILANWLHQFHLVCNCATPHCILNVPA